MMKNLENKTYLILAIAALIGCWYFNIQHILGAGTALSYFTDNLVNPASASIFTDISILYLTICVWFYTEGKKVGITYWWLYAIFGFFIAISVTFPLFLIHRALRLRAIKEKLN